MDRDEILRLKDEIKRAQNKARELLEGPLGLAQEQIGAMGGITKIAANAHLIIDQVGTPLTSGIERALSTARLRDEDLALLTGNHSALTALEESAKLLTGEHPAFGILEDRAKLLEGIGTESKLSHYDKRTTDVTFPVITSDVQRCSTR